MGSVSVQPIERHGRELAFVDPFHGFVEGAQDHGIVQALAIDPEAGSL